MTSAALVRSVTAAFRERTGRVPDGVWRAPGRVNLIGEHTDYNDGFVLPVAIDREVAVAAARRDDDRLRCWSTREAAPSERPLADIGPGGPPGWALYVEGVAWALLERGVPVGGADLVVDANLPVGAGLSSSAALEAAVVRALTDLAGARLAPVDLAITARRAETDVVGMPCGVMDQMASVCGRARHALFLDTRSLEAELVPLDLAREGLRLLVIDTRVRHQLTNAPYAERRRACHDAAAALGVAALRDVSLADVEAAAALLGDTGFRCARHVVTENARVLEVVAHLRDGDIAGTGAAMAASHASLRDDFRVSCPELDLAVDAAVAAGAVGARMTGAGFGGSALAFVPAEDVERVTTAIRERFAAHRYTDPGIFEVTPSDGAGPASA
jgi:galactokinase